MRGKLVAGLVLGAALVAGSPASAGGPIWGKDMVQGGYFPPPFGVSAVYFHQTQEYQLDKLSVGVPGFELVPANLIKIDNDLDEYNAKFDAWLLPYLNVFGLAGKLDGTTDVDFSAIQQAFQIPFSKIQIKYDGEVYGLGAVLAAGSDHFFGSLTAIATNTNLSGDFDSSASAFVLTPRLGIHNLGGALYAGAMYQRATEEHKGTINLPLVQGLPPIPVPFDIKLKQKDDWNWLAGAVVNLGPSWTLQGEAGFGNRDHVDIELCYRF